MSGEVNPREMLEKHSVTVRVVGWTVNDGVSTPRSYHMKVDGELYERDVGWRGDCWRKWYKKECTSRYYTTGCDGHWRKAGPRQQAFLAMLFTCAHRCGVIEDAKQ